MNAAVLGGLVEQWVWRCQKVATQYQLRQPIDLKAESQSWWVRRRCRRG